MDVVIDTSALLAVIAGEPEKEQIVRLTSGHTLIGPGSIPWEVGNAFSAMFKQGRLTLDRELMKAAKNSKVAVWEV
jgi:predicted nucleic acid-binding protein